MLSKSKWVLWIMLIALALAACSSMKPTPQPPTNPAETPTPEMPAYPGVAYPVETVPPESTPQVLEIPQEVMESILADLETRLGEKPANVEVLRSEPVTWSDGSLGCPEPGVFYTQALVEGYWVELKVGEATYDYRVGNPQTPPVLCQNRQ